MLPEMRAELGFHLRNPPTEGRVSEKTRCTADSQVLSGAVTLWTLRNPNLAPRPPIPADLQRRRMEQCAGVDATTFNSTRE